jgi:sporulation protein YlmC with PRC-barrel domain
MMTAEADLVRLSDSGIKRDHAKDLLGCTVFDRSGVDIGEVDDLLIDEQEHKVRFIQVASGGFLGLGAMHFLVPVDAINRIDDTTVFIDQSYGQVVGAPNYDPEVVPERPYCEGLYRHYGTIPYWQEGYRQPHYPHA